MTARNEDVGDGINRRVDVGEGALPPFVLDEAEEDVEFAIVELVLDALERHEFGVADEAEGRVDPVDGFHDVNADAAYRAVTVPDEFGCAVLGRRPQLRGEGWRRQQQQGLCDNAWVGHVFHHAVRSMPCFMNEMPRWNPVVVGRSRVLQDSDRTGRKRCPAS